jgi:ribosomal protein S18 acetylase RimI-like enzyme
MSAVIVRRATTGDLAAAGELAGHLVRLHHATDPERFFLPDRVEAGYAEWFARVLGDPKAALLVADASGTLTGYAYGGFEERSWNLLLDDHGAIHDLYVRDDDRRRGVGEALLAGLIRELEALGAARIVLSTMPSNHPAQRLFARFGFRPTLLEMTRDRGAPCASRAVDEGSRSG